MTENEALEYLKSSKRQNSMLGILPGSDIGNVIIKALEEVQEYRAIGTVEELKTASKYLRLVKMCGTVGKVIEECAEYEEIGTPEECRAAVEKQKAQTPDFEGDGYSDGHIVYDTWICPGCGEHYEVDYDKYEYCPNCGQKVSWEDLDEE